MGQSRLTMGLSKQHMFAFNQEAGASCFNRKSFLSTQYKIIKQYKTLNNRLLSKFDYNPKPKNQIMKSKSLWKAKSERDV